MHIIGMCHSWWNSTTIHSDYVVVFKGPPPHVKLQVWSFFGVIFCLFLDLQIDEVDSANQKKSEMMKKLQWCIEAAAAESSDKNTPHVDPMIKTTPNRDPMIKSGSMETQQSAPNIELYLHL